MPSEISYITLLQTTYSTKVHFHHVRNKLDWQNILSAASCWALTAVHPHTSQLGFNSFVHLICFHLAVHKPYHPPCDLTRGPTHTIHNGNQLS